MQKFIYTAFFITLLGLVQATPAYSLSNGASCNLCHVDPTGGGLRNDYGTTIFSLDELPLRGLTRFNEEDWDGQINKFIRFGGDFRLQTMVYQENDEVHVPIFPMQADVYAQVRAGKKLLFYYRQSLAAAGQNEFWLMLTQLPFEGWLKMGKALPDYGLKLPDHTAFIRGGNLRRTLGLDREGLFFGPEPFIRKPAIIELGLKPSSGFRITASIANQFARGTDAGYGYSEKLEDKAFTLKTALIREIAGSNTLLQISGIKEGNLTAVGLSGGISRNSISWLFEFDHVKNWTGSELESAVLHHELYYELFQGLKLLVKYDHLDPDIDVRSGAIERYTAGFEVTPYSVLGVLFEIRQSRVENLDREQPDPEFLIQLHSWF